MVYLAKQVCKFAQKPVYEIDPWGQSHKHFWCKFTNSLSKLDLFNSVQHILFTLIKWSSLQKWE